MSLVPSWSRRFNRSAAMRDWARWWAWLRTLETAPAEPREVSRMAFLAGRQSCEDPVVFAKYVSSR